MKKPMKRTRVSKTAHKRKNAKRRKNPGFGMNFLLDFGPLVGNLMVNASLGSATLSEKTLIAAAIPFLLKVMRGDAHKDVKTKLRDFENHWAVFKPHCPTLAGILCPSECKHSKELRFDGCHVCDCLKGKTCPDCDVPSSEKHNHAKQGTCPFCGDTSMKQHYCHPPIDSKRAAKLRDKGKI